MRATPLLLLLPLLAGCAAPRPPARDAAEALDRGTAYLLSVQNRDGSFGTCANSHVHELYLGTLDAHHSFSDASTALCAMALLGRPEAPAVRSALERALDRLCASGPCLRQTGDAIYSIWGNAYALECLSKAMRDPRFAPRRDALESEARRRIATLLQQQSLNGGWAYYDFACRTRVVSGDKSTPFSTAAALVALDEARKAALPVPEENARAGTAFLLSLRLGNGAYAYSEDWRFHPNRGIGKIQGSLSRTQAGDCALKRWGAGGIGEEQLSAALENLFKYHYLLDIGRQRQWPHETWYAIAGYFYFFGHYYAGLNVADLPEPARAKYAARLEAVLLKDQEPDGSWWDFPIYGYSKAYGTGYAMMALNACRGSSR